MTVEGLRVLTSRHNPAETLERLEAAIHRHGFKIATRFDHSAAAKAVGMEMHPSVVVMFGSARAGAPTVQKAPTLAIDLPLKVLIWQDEKGATQAAYNDPAWVLRRHGVDDASVVEITTEVLANVVGEAVA
jgi:uncharacterized protein (DUF302 family)